MFHFLVFFLSLYQLSPVSFSETIDTSKFSISDLHNDDLNPKSQTEIPFQEPIDYPSNSRIKNYDENEIDFNDLSNAIAMLKAQRQRQQLNNNFLRFGKRQVENMPTEQALEQYEPETQFERSYGPDGVRDSRSSSYIRFGRSDPKTQLLRLGRLVPELRFGRTTPEFMRFGRNPSDFLRFGRLAPELRFGRTTPEFMRFGRNPSDFLRFGRSDPSDFMRFGRSQSNIMRPGRTPSDFMRFGRNPSDFMRFGRASTNFMRLGRTPSPSNFMRLGRSQDKMLRLAKGGPKISKNFMRTGRLDNFIRFGRASSTENDINPNFMRFGKRQKNEASPKSSEQNQTEKTMIDTIDSTTSFPYNELQNVVDPIDMMFLNDSDESNADNDDNDK